MPLLLDTFPSNPTAELRTSNCVTVGLINNMPDAAVEATERQFIDLMRAASSRVVVRLQLFSIPEIPRDGAVRQELGERYRDISKIWDSHIDGLIVTGTEPRARNLRDEPYWNTLSQVVDWAYDHTTSAIWSCLAAHAAVLRTDGIEREPATDKVSGIFECETVALHPMTMGQPFRLGLLAKALKHVANHPQRDRVWFTLPGQIAGHCAALPPGIVP